MLNLCVGLAMAVVKFVGIVLAIEVLASAFLFVPLHLLGVFPTSYYPAGLETFVWLLAGVGYVALGVGVFVLITRRVRP